jgi:hypothetical protein
VRSARRLYNAILVKFGPVPNEASSSQPVLGEFQMKSVPDEFSVGSEGYKSSEEEESPSPYEDFKCEVKTLCVL